MKRRVEKFIRENKLCDPGDRILAAVSGGADSVCLLHVLVKLQKAWKLKLRVVHVNHQLRGRDKGFEYRAGGQFCAQVYGYGVVHAQYKAQSTQNGHRTERGYLVDPGKTVL